MAVAKRQQAQMYVRYNTHTKPLQATATNHKLIKKIKDERFDEERIHQYILIVNIGIRDLQVAVMDEEDDRIIFFEDYVMGDLASPDDWLLQLKGLFEAHPLLMAGFWKKVKIGIKNNKFVQVPSSLFIESSAAEYLRFNSHFDDEKEVILFDTPQRAGAVTVFALYKSVHEWLNGIYANTRTTYVHQSTALIEGVMDFDRGLPESPLYIYVDRFKLHVLAVRENKLIYYNQFIIKQFSDYVKYIMLVMNALNMNQQNSHVVLWGYIGKNSPHYHEFVKYIRNVSFGSRPLQIKFGYLFDELQEHNFFDLYSIELTK